MKAWSLCLPVCSVISIIVAFIILWNIWPCIKTMDGMMYVIVFVLLASCGWVIIALIVGHIMVAIGVIFVYPIIYCLHKESRVNEFDDMYEQVIDCLFFALIRHG